MRHTKLVDELNDASKSLSSAMDRYLQACGAIPNHYEIGSNTAQVLLDYALSEIPKVSDYEEKLRRARAALRRTRNQCPKLVPISTLPFEVMSHIFWLSWDCLLSASNRSNLVYPSVLLRVCSRWRQITLGSHKLWSHIDVYTSWAPNLSLNRIKLFMKRSGQLPLDLHIKTGLLSLRHHEALGDFYRSVAPRIQSFEIHHGDDLHPLYGIQQPWLDTLLSGAKAGTLTQLCIKSYGLQAVPALLIAKDSSLAGLAGRSYIRISATERQLEDLLSSVTRLQLKGIYPLWPSHAYRGLIELSLEVFRGANITIKDSELAVMLQESPGLRALHFGLGVELTEDNCFPLPVQLNNLESLQLTSHSHSAQESVLRMVHPGQAPLRLTIKVPDESHFVLPSSAWTEFADFVSRSIVEQLHIEQREKGYFDPLKTLPLMSHLKVLTLDGFKLGKKGEELLGGYDAASYLSMVTGYDSPSLPQQLRLLRLIRCTIYWSEFRHASEIHPTGKLILDRCEVDFHPSVKLDLETVLRGVVPAVELYETRARGTVPGPR